MPSHPHAHVSGFSGNELFCLHELGMEPGPVETGNCVIALGLGGSLKTIARLGTGGEAQDVTRIVREGRQMAVERLLATSGALFGGQTSMSGIELSFVKHGGNLEFLAVGSQIKSPGPGAASERPQPSFSTAADGQQMYCLKDAGFAPQSYVFGNVAYALGIGRDVSNLLARLRRGEITSLTEVFNITRHKALERIKQSAAACGASAVLGIQTTMDSLFGAQEMMMSGTACSHPLMQNQGHGPATSDMTLVETWNMAALGYAPVEVVMGISVYALGIKRGLLAWFSSFTQGEVTELSSLLHEARDRALKRVQASCEAVGGEKVVGTKLYVQELGGGVIEVMAMGTAVRKIEGMRTQHAQLLPQAFVKDVDTYVEPLTGRNIALTSRADPTTRVRPMGSPLSKLFSLLAVLVALFIKWKLGIRD